MFVCFHAGGLRSQIYLTRIPRSLCEQAALLSFSSYSHYLLAGMRNVAPLVPGPLPSLALPSLGQLRLEHFFLFLPSPSCALGTAIAGLLKVPHFPVSPPLG